MKRLLVGLLALIATTPAWAAKPDAAVVIPRVFEAQAGCSATGRSQVELTQCALAAAKPIWEAQDLDDSMKRALADYGRDMLATAQAADARTINELAQFRQRARAEQALRLAMFGRSVRLTDPGLDEAAMPTKEDLVRVFPAKASAEKRDGQAVMSCRVMRDGALSACHILAEVPPDYGFGQAAIELSKMLKGKPATLNGQPIGGAEIRFALGFDPAWL